MDTPAEVSAAVAEISNLLAFDKKGAPAVDPVAEFARLHGKVEDLRRVQSGVTRVGRPAGQSVEDGLAVFYQFLKDGGCTSLNNVEVAQFPEGSGLRAKADFKMGDTILQIPTSVIMTEHDTNPNAVSHLCLTDPLISSLPTLKLALRVLHESTISNSVWLPYINVLPTSFDIVLFFTPDDMRRLQGSPTIESALKFYKNALRQYCYLHQLLTTTKDKENKRLTLGQTLFNQRFTLDNFFWALGVVMTRQNRIPHLTGAEPANLLALIPLWDMCNHTHQGEITTFFQEERRAVECRAVADFRTGEQVMIMYGPRPNAELLIHSGFVVDGNPYDSLPIMLGLVAGDSLAPVKGGILRQIGVATECQFQLVRQELDPNVLSFLRVIHLNLDEIKGKLYVGVFEENKPVSDRCTIEALRALIQACTAALAKYPTTIQDDEAALAAGGLTGTGRAATQLVLGEKRILAANVEMARAELGRLGAAMDVPPALVARAPEPAAPAAPTAAAAAAGPAAAAAPDAGDAEADEEDDEKVVASPGGPKSKGGKKKRKKKPAA